MNKVGNLLLVENDRAVREALVRVLVAEEFQVVAAASKREALVAFSQDPVDVVFLDLNLDGEDGWAVFDMLKDLQADLPIVVTSAQVERLAHPSVVRASGALEKPYDVAVLVSLLKCAASVSVSKGKPASFKRGSVGVLNL